MMDKKTGFTLVLGGVRSGKSDYARRLCEAAPGEPQKVYLATAAALDPEMSLRIERHKSERGALWATVEEPVEVAKSITSTKPGSIILLDCLTLWLTNLMGLDLGDDEISGRVDGLAAVMSVSTSAVVVVSNDVGGGITPLNAMARRFADLSGFMNQRMAAAADEVYYITAGIPRRLK
ncbi:MAG: bifunctional adenosylcobinamide kinase/adenosylcobinamide-phosphate guanylyltransferase [Thermodesulfobacteriota bacterium]